MARPRTRFLSVLLISAAAAFCAWRFLPSTLADRSFFTAVAHTSANPPFIISGHGTTAQPWSLQMISPYQKADPASAPLVISLGDDTEGIFQSSPPSPVDIAIILKNMRRLGASRAAVSAVMAWEKPDTIALSALDSELANFQSLATAAPLSRTANTAALPPTFRRASVALDRIRGDTSSLPTVNHVALPGVILGGDSAMSGFSILEREENEKSLPLIARWEDRAVFSFPLIAVLAQRGLPIDALEIELGNFIKIGSDGPVIPIDEFGRMAAPLAKFTDLPFVKADTLIDATAPLPIPAQSPVLLRDDQSAAEAGTREFSRKIAATIAAIASGAGMSAAQKFQRLAENVELISLGALSLLVALLSFRGRFSRQLLLGIFAAILLIAHFITAGTASIWLPTLPALATLFSAFLVGRFFREETLKPVIAAEPPASLVIIPEPPPEIPVEIAPEPKPPKAANVEPIAKKPAANKSPARKTTAKELKKIEEKPAAAKKAAAKKTPPAKKAPAKKTPAAKKSNRRKKSPPESSP